MQTMKLFADMERKRRQQEVRDQEERKRKRDQEIAEEEQKKAEKEWQKNFEVIILLMLVRIIGFIIRFKLHHTIYLHIYIPGQHPPPGG